MSKGSDLRLDAIDLGLGPGRFPRVVMGDLRVLPRPKRGQLALEAVNLTAMPGLGGRNGADSEQSNDRSRGGDETR